MGDNGDIHRIAVSDFTGFEPPTNIRRDITGNHLYGWIVRMGQGSEKGVVILQLVTLILPSKGMITGKSHRDSIEVSTRRSRSEFCCWTLLVTMIGSQRLTLEAYKNTPRQKLEGRFQMLTAQLLNPSLRCLKTSNRGITWRSSIWRSSVFPRQRPLKSFSKPSRRHAAQILCGAGRDKWIFGECYWHWTGDDLASWQCAWCLSLP